ncbi:MAG: ATP-binding cassette domain-containing protein [Alphaproteobacteria bacterium]|nr:ATP-binding cassette domain-containing protein [Alphaproteobacteria bacterium]
MRDQPVLDVDDLRVEFRTGRETIHAVNGVSFQVATGETAAILGESGSGKSVTAAAIMRLLQSPPAFVTGGAVRFKGKDVLAMPIADWRDSCGREVAMVFQDALMSLNPVFSVGWQIAELFRAHSIASGRAADERAVELLDRVGIPDPARRAKDYTHQFSGGMRQRVMIAMAIALGPDLLIADEPTTALDVTVQAQIMELLEGLREEADMAMILITHDLGVVADAADNVAVMYAGRVVERGPVGDVLRRPGHAYTLALLDSVPRVQSKGGKLRPIVGSPPDLARIPTGCAFHPRCRFATDICRREAPPAVAVAPGCSAECHHVERVFNDG